MLYFSEMHGFDQHGDMVCIVTPELLKIFNELVQSLQALPVEKLIEERRAFASQAQTPNAVSRPVLKLVR